jgi:hypothetical protein
MTRLKLIMEGSGKHIIVRMPSLHGNAADAELQAALSAICTRDNCDLSALHASGVEELLLWCKDSIRLTEVADALVSNGWHMERLHEDHARLLHH